MHKGSLKSTDAVHVEELALEELTAPAEVSLYREQREIKEEQRQRVQEGANGHVLKDICIDVLCKVPNGFHGADFT